MKRILHNLSLATAGFAFGVAAIGSTAAISSAQVQFKNVSFAEAQKLAAKENKKVMVDFYTSWCKWCKVLDYKTYADRGVGEVANKDFVSIKIDAEKGEGIELAKKYGVTGYPTIVFYDAKGKELDRVRGFEEAAKFARSLKLASDGGGKSIMDKAQTKAGMTDPLVQLQLADYYAKSENAAKAIEAYDRVMTLDRENQKEAFEQAIYGKAFLLTGAEQIRALDEAFLRYPARPEASSAMRLLLNHDFTAAPEAAANHIDEYARHHSEDGDMFNFFAWEAATKGVLLERAEEYAQRAVQFSPFPADRAAALDTKAEVVARLGRPDHAVVYEQQAISLLNPEQDKKLIKEFEARLKEFEAKAAELNSNAVGISPVEAGGMN